MERGDILHIKFNGKNYLSWSFHLHHYMDGQGLGGYLDGTTSAPVDDKDAKATTTWTQNNSKVVTWILNSIEPSISLSLHSFSKASEMWNHLKKLHHQTNKARKFLLDIELSKYNQGQICTRLI